MDLEDIRYRTLLEQRISRRKFLRNTTLTAIGGLAAASGISCAGSPIGSGNPTVTYWNLFGGGDGARMIQMQDAFVRSHPDIDLKAVTLAWGEPYYTKLAMSSAGGRPPDIGISHITRMPAFAQLGFLEPFDLGELAKFGITQNDFLPEVWQRAQYQGKVYAIPLDTHPFVMYYNIDICKKAGLLGSDGNLKPIQGTTALIDALKQVKQATGNWGLTFIGAWRLFNALYSQLGGKILSADGKEMVLDNSKAEQALSFMADLTVNSKVAFPTTDYGSTVALFGSGKAGFYWNGEWEVTTFQAIPNFHFNMVPFPNIFGGTQTEGDSHSFILPRQAYPDPVRRAATFTFMSFMLKDGFTWAQGGHIPAYLPVATSQAYKNLKPQSNYAGAAKDVVLDPPAWFSGSGSDFETLADGVFGAVILGQLTPAKAVQQFRAGLQRMLDTPAPTSAT
jgi:multiple sugar transport system substrate-binding protein